MDEGKLNLGKTLKATDVCNIIYQLFIQRFSFRCFQWSSKLSLRDQQGTKLNKKTQHHRCIVVPFMLSGYSATSD